MANILPRSRTEISRISKLRLGTEHFPLDGQTSGSFGHAKGNASVLDTGSELAAQSVLTRPCVGLVNGSERAADNAQEDLPAFLETYAFLDLSTPTEGSVDGPYLGGKNVSSLKYHSGKIHHVEFVNIRARISGLELPDNASGLRKPNRCQRPEGIQRPLLLFHFSEPHVSF